MSETDLDYAKLTGRLALTVADGDDAGENPDITWCDEGTVEITPLIPFAKVTGAAEGPFTTGNSVIEATINSEGYLSLNGQLGIWLIDLTSPKVNPRIGDGFATHSLVFKNIRANGLSVLFPPVTLRLTRSGLSGDGINDLTLISPVVEGDSIPNYVGATGPQGVSISDLTVFGGDLIVTLSDGVEINAGELPQGDKGDTGDKGDKGDIGNQGPVGSQGVPGIQGIQGERGLTGDQGTLGPQGPVGPVGVNLSGDWDAGVDYARLDGVSYGGASWYASVDPPTGAVPGETSPYWHYLSQKGEQGVQGLQGVQGEQGVQGVQGNPGSGSVNSVNGDFGPDVQVDWVDIPGVIPDASLPSRLGVSAVIVTDANAINASGLYRLDPSSANLPPNWADTHSVAVLRAEHYDPLFYSVQTIIGDVDFSTASDSYTWIRWSKYTTEGRFWTPWEKTLLTQTELDARYLNVGEAITDAQLPARLGNSPQVILDCNGGNALDTGWWMADSTQGSLNTPEGGGYYFGETQQFGEGGIYFYQEAYGLFTGSRYSRQFNGTSWTSWVRGDLPFLDTRYQPIGSKAVTDWNDAYPSGLYWSASGSLNCPESTDSFFIGHTTVGNSDGQWAEQEVYKYVGGVAESGNRWRRYAQAINPSEHAWTAWIKVVDQKNELDLLYKNVGELVDNSELPLRLNTGVALDNVNEALLVGSYWALPSTPNIPAPGYYFIDVQNFSGDRRQTATRYADENGSHITAQHHLVWTRVIGASGIWSPWVRKDIGRALPATDTRRWPELLTYSDMVDNVAATLRINTNIKPPTLFQIHVKGWTFYGYEIDFSIVGYNQTPETIGLSMVTHRSYEDLTVRLGHDANENLVILVDKVNTWSYPTLTVDLTTSYIGSTDSTGNSWTVNLSNDVGVTNIFTPTSITFSRKGHTHPISELQAGVLGNDFLRNGLRSGYGTGLVQDWDLIAESGWYSGYQATNSPDLVNWWYGEVVQLGADPSYVMQTVTMGGNGVNSQPANGVDSQTFRRARDGGVWGSWHKLNLYQSEMDARYAALVLGKVAQSALTPNVQRFLFTTAGTSRPSGSTYVEWVGPVQPTNAVAGDTWVNNS